MILSLSMNVLNVGKCLCADIAGGYVAFVVSILGIGLLTAVIGDLASHLGCSVGIKDSVTAIAFVALGTSIPGNYQHGQQQHHHTTLNTYL